MLKNYTETAESKIFALKAKRAEAHEDRQVNFDLAINLVKLRTAHNKSQIEMANDLSVNQKNISQWESATVTPSLRYLKLLAWYYDVTVDELLKVDDIQ